MVTDQRLPEPIALRVVADSEGIPAATGATTPIRHLLIRDTLAGDLAASVASAVVAVRAGRQRVRR